MLNGSEIKKSIKSISDTHEITKAMQLISVAKRRKASERYDKHKSYHAIIADTVLDIIEHADEVSHSYLEKRQGKRVGYIVIASDKGLCGCYNHRVLDLALDNMQNVEEKYVFTIGFMAQEYFKAKGISVDVEFLHIISNPTLEDARGIFFDITNLWKENHLDEVKIIFTKVNGLAQYDATVETLLPITVENLNKLAHSERANDHEREYFYHYDKVSQETLGVVLDHFLLGEIYSALIQSVSSEHYERMMSMENASRNGEKLLAELSLKYNKIRQEKITTELVEATGGKINIRK